MMDQCRESRGNKSLKLNRKKSEKNEYSLRDSETTSSIMRFAL